MRKILAVFSLLLLVCAVTTWKNGNFLHDNNIGNQLQSISYLGIIGLGVAFVIITGGIDLSIGSVIGLVGCVLPILLDRGMPIPVALLCVAGMSLAIGLLHGLLITQVRLQPFIVTLCGMLAYRGIARGITADQGQGFGMKYEMFRKLAMGRLSLSDLGLHTVLHRNYWIPASIVFLVVLIVAASVFLNLTIYGRYLLALGRNEQAARYSGIQTHRMVLLSYVLCSLAAGLAGVLLSLDINSIQPASHGDGYELYAIAVAVLGGCSLRGGEGTVVGVVLGAALLTVLRNSMTFLDIPDPIERAIIAGVILAGVLVDELIRRFAASRRVLSV